MHENICKTCSHYRQHYVLDQRKIFRIYCGHCTCQKYKRKKPYTAACDNYIPTPPDEDAFASKEYLSKELLQYLLKLELLPTIENADEVKPK